MAKRARHTATNSGSSSDMQPAEKYVLRLYIAGATPRSSRAVANIKHICEHNLNGRYDLEVIDLYQQPTLAKDEQIVAAPMLIKKLPTPLRRFIGDLSDKERILVGMDLVDSSRVS
ncbi:MAG TPA: circadian clock KaiB family protein [Terriglobales bacterium]|nr:circadian clock KaiB family protein [Terriglobales bacterium]